MAPTYLKDLNKHPKDDTIKLEESTHTYYINGKKGYTSVTQFNHSLFEGFNASKVIDKMMASKNWSKSKYFGKTKQEIMKEWTKNG